MNNASEKIPHEVRHELCKNKCEIYDRCSEPRNNDCERLFALAQQHNSNIKEQPAEDVVKEPSHYKQHAFQMIDEMIIMFGVEATIQYCRMNAWKYRTRAPYKGNLEQDNAKADNYLDMAYNVMQIRQEHPEADGYEVCFLLKGRNEEGK